VIKLSASSPLDEHLFLRLFSPPRSGPHVIKLIADSAWAQSPLTTDLAVAGGNLSDVKLINSKCALKHR
jgi:hypothetical protein